MSPHSWRKSAESRSVESQVFKSKPARYSAQYNNFLARDINPIEFRFEGRLIRSIRPSTRGLWRFNIKLSRLCNERRLDSSWKLEFKKKKNSKRLEIPKERMDEAKREGRNTPSLLPFCSSSVQDIALPSAWPRPFHPLKFRPSVCGRDPEAASKGSIIGAECNRPWKPIPPSCTSNPRFEESLKKKEKNLEKRRDSVEWTEFSRQKREEEKPVGRNFVCEAIIVG